MSARTFLPLPDGARTPAIPTGPDRTLSRRGRVPEQGLGTITQRLLSPLVQSGPQPRGAASSSGPPARSGPSRPYLERQVVDAAQAGLGQQLQQPQQRKQPEARDQPRTVGARRGDRRRGGHVCSSITSCFLCCPLPGLKGSGCRKSLESVGSADGGTVPVALFLEFAAGKMSPRGRRGPPRSSSVGFPCSDFRFSQERCNPQWGAGTLWLLSWEQWLGRTRTGHTYSPPSFESDPGSAGPRSRADPGPPRLGMCCTRTAQCLADSTSNVD